MDLDILPEPRVPRHVASSAVSTSADSTSADSRRTGSDAGRRAADAPARSRALIAQIAAAIRVVQLIPWPVTMLTAASTGLARPGLAVAVYAVQAAWSLAWAGLILDRRRIPPWTMAVDVPVAAAALVLAGLACQPGEATTWANSAVTPSIGTAVAAAAVLPFARAVGAVAALVAAYLGGLVPALRSDSSGWSVATANCCAIVGLAVVAGLAAAYLLRQSQAASEVAAALADARARLAAGEERDRERAQHYRTLHDTVLSTLSALARGGLDPTDPQVRQRCAADADYLRGLISTAGLSSANRVQAELAALARAQAGLGLRVQVRCADLPARIEAPVARAVVDAAREALNNVAKHSGAAQAWVTAVGDGEESSGFTVTVADQGRGFDPQNARAGLGLAESITGRVAEVGGAVQIDSSPGQGTTVELRWPA